MREQTTRVAVRHLLARLTLGPDILKIETLVKQRAYEDALTALDTFLNTKLNVRVLPRRDDVYVKTEWLHTLPPQEKNRYLGVVEALVGARRMLMEMSPEKLDQEGMKLERLLDDAREEMPWVEEISRGTEDEFKHGPFTIILTAGAEGGLEDAIKALDSAAGKIRGHFPKVLYGKIYVRKGTIKSERGSDVAGSYVAAGDFLNLSLYATPNRESLHTLIHEFGHRYHTRFLKGDDREKFIELSTVGDVQKSTFSLSERRKIADELLALYREHQQERYPDSDMFLSERTQQWNNAYPQDEWKRRVVPLLRRFRDEKDEAVAKELAAALGKFEYGGAFELIFNEAQLKPLYASDYGRVSWQENFAESFLAFVLGAPLPEPLQRFMQGMS